MVANIVIEVRDVDYRFYHTDFRISNRHLTLFRIGRIADHQKQETEEIGERGTHLVGGAFDIVGVEIVNISPYQLSVGISQAVAWGPVEKQLFDLFERVFEIEDRGNPAAQNPSAEGCILFPWDTGLASQRPRTGNGGRCLRSRRRTGGGTRQEMTGAYDEQV